MGARGEFPWDAWRAVLDAAERTLAAAGLGRALAAAGCTQPTILTALTDPVHPTEVAWVLELLTTAPRGSLVRRCGGGEFVPVTRAPVGGNG
jgi:hypothetical protein